MNDADLEKLGVKPGKLEPAFNRETLQYSMLLASSITNLSINPVTRDADATWTVVGLGNIKTIPIIPGETKIIKIEVTAEDGTTKEYNINVVSLSPSCAVLSDIKVTHGSLSPEFKSNCYDYAASLPWYLDSITVLPEAIDKGIEGANKGIGLILNYGETLKTIEIMSPDKTSTAEYRIKFRKDRLLRSIATTGCEGNILKSCPICLGILYCPVSLTQQESKATSSKKLFFCRSCVETLTRTRKQDPFTEKPLPPDFIKDQNEHEKILALMKVLCCYYNFGCEEKVELRKLGKHLKECNFQPMLAHKFEGVIGKNEFGNEEYLKTAICQMCSHPVRNNELNTHLKFYCPSKHPNTRFNHIVELRNWERKFHDKAIQRADDPDDCVENAPTGKMVQEELEIAAQNYARMIKMTPRDPVNHFKLATVLEEMYYAQDMCGIKKEEIEEENEDKDFDNLMDIASDSSKEDDIKALCEQRGVNRNAPLSLVLKAIDEEYHSLLDQNQSAKADYVQKLYSWKSKQSVQQSVGNFGANDKDGGLLNKALLKCQDALACDPNNSKLHMHVGRYLLMQGRHEDAMKRLEAAFGLKPTSIEARFYLGLAYMKHYARQYRGKYNTLQYLQDGIDYALYKMCEYSSDQESKLCSGEVFVRDSNVLILEGMLELGNILQEKGYSTEMEKLHIIGMYEQTSTICFHVMSHILHRNQIYQQLKWIVLRAQLSLGIFLTTELLTKRASSEQRRIMQEHWERLAALSRAFELPPDSSILDVQRQIGEEAVALMPASSKALYHLGDIQLALFDLDAEGNNEYLKEAENSYRASIFFEGKDSKNRDVAWPTQESKWWKERLMRVQKLQMQPKVAVSTQLKSTVSKSAIRPKAVAATKLTTAVASSATKPTTVVASSATRRSSKASTAQKAPTRAARTSLTKPSTVPTTTKSSSTTPRGKTSSPSKTNQNPSASKPSNTPSTKKSAQNLAKKSSAHNSASCAASEAPAKKPAATAVTTLVKPPEKPQEKATPKQQAPKEEIILNEASFQARLGLARALSRTQDDSSRAEITELYKTVIAMAPHVHDAYIELGDMLAKSGPQQAIEIYSKYPFGEELSFDDAYLHGEIIRLIMKLESYDDPNLEKSLIAYGTVMGFSALEKHVGVLENKFKFGVLKNVYAGVNKKDINDEDLQQFFKFKLWV